MLMPVIMSGGNGTRLWPMSRGSYPKQFLNLHGDKTLFRATLERLDGLDTLPPTIICNEHHRFLVAEQLRAANVPFGAILLEPEGRNTAPAVALAALQAMEQHDDPVLLVLASDHVIEDREAFQAQVARACELAENGRFVTFGVVPTQPETGYGYIRAREGGGISAVDAFVEKPDVETARAYCRSGDYYWNSGMFVFRASQYLEALGEFRPDILSACESAIKTLEGDLDFVRVDKDTFLQCPSESIDYAVMEPMCQSPARADNLWVVPMEAGWSDVGCWSALWGIAEKDVSGNVFNGDVLALETTGSYVRADGKLVAAIGLRDLVVIDTKDAILVARQDKVQDVKRVVEELRQRGREECQVHREIYRPWGKYDSVDFGDRYQVKRITVKPGEKLSVQMHHHRAEHWIVVSGTARIRCGEEERLLTENQSAYIPVGEVHYLENPGKIPLELIEVQSGSYLGEDDIVRIEDRYGRT